MNQKNRILVVDDDPSLLETAELLIGDAYQVLFASSGAQAISIIKEELPDLVMLDIDMPGMDGFETFVQIQKIDANMPVIFLTGMTESKAELEGLTLGAQDFITKPFVRDNLLARIKLRIENGKNARQLEQLRSLKYENTINEKRFNTLASALTSTEKEVALLVVRGLSNQEIAEKLNYSHGYIKNLSSLIFSKLGVHNRRELRKLFQET